MRELDVVGVRVEMPSNAPMVLLREVGGSRYLPIWIGAAEAAAIANAQEGIVPPRPLTHDLMVDTLSTLGHRLTEVSQKLPVEQSVSKAQLVAQVGFPVHV